ncbi:MAG: tetratricopeptide repeat protein [Rikenellaceae bacterium]
MKILLSIILSITTLSLSAQELGERREVRKGNSKFHKSEYSDAIDRYAKALEIAPKSFAAGYNLGNAIYRSEDYPKAEQQLNVMAADSLLADDDRADALYNLGNSLFQQQKLEEALESYKDALRLRPDDMECKYNYAYTKRLLEQQQQDQQENQDQQQDQDQGDEQQQEQDQNGEGDQEQEQNQEQNQEQEQEQDQEQEQNQEPQPQDGEISQQEQDQILDAIQAQEDKTQDKLDEMRRGVVIPGRKSW